MMTRKEHTTCLTCLGFHSNQAEATPKSNEDQDELNTKMNRCNQVWFLLDWKKTSTHTVPFVDKIGQPCLKHMRSDSRRPHQVGKNTRRRSSNLPINCPVSQKRLLKRLQVKAINVFISTSSNTVTLIDFERKWKGELKTCENLSRTSFYPSLNAVLQCVMN